MKRGLLALTIAAAVAAFAAAAAAPSDIGGKTVVKVMTYNIYQGTELEHALAAHNLFELAIGAATDYGTMVQTNFPERAQALAAEIASASPDLVGLQEVALWRTRFPSNPALRATDVSYDFLQILLAALASAGEPYTAVGMRDNFDAQATGLFSFGLMDVRLTDRSAILVRSSDLASGKLTISNVQSHDYVANAVIPTLGGPFTVLGGWQSVDVSEHGAAFRFLTTHGDPISPLARTAQAVELVTGPLATSLPVVADGDFNSTSSTVAYATFAAAGLVDAWASRYPGDPGLTCCQVPPDTIVNPVSQLRSRIDYVFVRGGFRVLNAHLYGDQPQDRTPSGLWPSDHAGLGAVLQLP